MTGDAKAPSSRNLQFTHTTCPLRFGVDHHTGWDKGMLDMVITDTLATNVRDTMATTSTASSDTVDQDGFIQTVCHAAVAVPGLFTQTNVWHLVLLMETGTQPLHSSAFVTRVMPNTSFLKRNTIRFLDMQILFLGDATPTQSLLVLPTTNKERTTHTTSQRHHGVEVRHTGWDKDMSPLQILIDTSLVNVKVTTALTTTVTSDTVQQDMLVHVTTTTTTPTTCQATSGVDHHTGRDKDTLESATADIFPVNARANTDFMITATSDTDHQDGSTHINRSVTVVSTGTIILHNV